MEQVEPICRPKPPGSAKSWVESVMRWDLGMYRVMQGEKVVAIYNSFYFRSAHEVVGDFLGLIERGLELPHTGDYVVWCGYRVMAAIHDSMSEDRRESTFFSEPGNEVPRSEGLPGWPTYNEWVANGRGDLWKTDVPDYPHADD
jgi:hypothetical protein